MPKRRHQLITNHIATRIRSRRLLVGLSQQALGKSTGVSFQQIQKYENGRNSLSAEKLHEVAQRLGVPISYFFEGLDIRPATHTVSAEDEQLLFRFMSSGEGLSLSLPFVKIRDTRLRKKIIELVKALSETTNLRPLEITGPCKEIKNKLIASGE